MNLIGAGINYYSSEEETRKQNSLSISDFGGLNLAVQFMF